MKTSTIFAFLGGAALGAMMALLLAPDKGVDTRKKLRRKLKEHGIDLSKEEWDELMNRFRRKVSKEHAEKAE